MSKRKSRKKSKCKGKSLCSHVATAPRLKDAKSRRLASSCIRKRADDERYRRMKEVPFSALDVQKVLALLSDGRLL